MSQSSAWVGQQIQRSIDGGKSLALPEHKPYQEASSGFLDAAGNTWWIAIQKPT